jgi:ornithine--oxo-acid transaminase
MLPQNSGVEGWEVALKLARKWAYTTKRVAPDAAVVLFPEGNFGGRTLGAISASTDPSSYGGYGPLLPGIAHVPFGDARAVEAALAANPNIVAFYTEPIQGEAGIVLPPPGYLAEVKAACARHGALLIADEVQTGLGRTGALLASGDVRPDIVVLGKALGGGVLPVSAVLADDAIMLSIKPGEHGSTFGGNPLACAVATASLRVILEERLCENAVERGAELLEGYRGLWRAFPRLFKEARGVGLMHALEMKEDALDAEGKPISALDVCLALGRASELYGAEVGLLTKPTHGNTIRLTPPLVITKAQVAVALKTMNLVLEQLQKGGRVRLGRA